MFYILEDLILKSQIQSDFKDGTVGIKLVKYTVKIGSAWHSSLLRSQFRSDLGPKLWDGQAALCQKVPSKNGGFFRKAVLLYNFHML